MEGSGKRVRTGNFKSMLHKKRSNMAVRIGRSKETLQKMIEPVDYAWKQSQLAVILILV